MSQFCLLSTKSYSICSPLGTFMVHCCEKGIHQLFLDPNISDENFNPKPSNVELILKDAKDSVPCPVQECLQWLKLYFENPFSTKETPHLCPLEDNQKFGPKVWRQLFENVKSGDTITYKKLAVSMNNPGAARAVGTAMKNNPICIIVPCHRVVRSNGLGLYHGGKRQKVKKWLLDHEAKHQL